MRLRTSRHTSPQAVPRVAGGRRVALFVLAFALVASGVVADTTPAGAAPAGAVPVTVANAPALPAMPDLPPLPDFGPTFTSQASSPSSAPNLELPDVDAAGSKPIGAVGACATAGSGKPATGNADDDGDDKPATGEPDGDKQDKDDKTGQDADRGEGKANKTCTVSTTTTTTPLPDWFAGTGREVVQGGNAAMSALAQRYGSFGGAMLGLYAKQTGQPIGQFAEANAGIVQALLGSTIGDDLTAALADSSNLDQLQSTLGRSGLSANTTASGANSFSQTIDTIAQRPGSLDAQVSLAGANWAAGLANVRMPTVDAGALGQVAPTGAEISIGAYINSTLAAMASDYPDLLGQITKSGAFSPAAQGAWQASMLKAFGATSRSTASSLPAPCNAAMLASMASGSANAGAVASGSSNCGSCVAAGLYLNSQMMRLTDPKATSTIANPNDGFIPPVEWNALQSWQRNALAAQNPGLASGLSTSASVPTSCSGATSNAIGVSLSGVFGNLGR